MQDVWARKQKPGLCGRRAAGSPARRLGPSVPFVFAARAGGTRPAGLPAWLAERLGAGLRVGEQPESSARRRLE